MIVPFILTVIAAIFRFTSLNWDMGGRLHPDEALIVNGALSVKFFSQLFPGFHDYNGFAVYLLKTASLVASVLLRSSYWSTTPEGVTLVGRFVSALLATLSIPLIYTVAKRVWNKDVGLFAGLVFACTPLLIQLAHFYTTESILIFLLLVLLLAAVLYSKKADTHSLIRMAIPMGLLLATKNTAYLFLLIPVAVICTKHKPSRIALSLIMLACITLLTFFAASPYSFLDLSGYLSRSQYLSDVVSGKLLMDWTLQFQHTSPLFWVPNLGIAFGPMILGVIGGIGQLIHQKFWKKVTILSVFALWMCGYTMFILVTYLKFIRYSAPLAPFIALFFAKFLWDVRKSRNGAPITFTLVAIQIIWAIMCFHIYLVPNPSITAARWIATHIPDRSVILTEEWNSIIRFDQPPLSRKQLGFFSFSAYSTETEDKMKTLTYDIQNSQYIILESPKIRNTIAHLSNRYPHTDTFYTQLAQGKLGYTLVAKFSSYPQLGPLAINDESAEETWYAFDHPTVSIYRKNSR